jgi:hypothetical protein
VIRPTQHFLNKLCGIGVDVGAMHADPVTVLLGYAEADTAAHFDNLDPIRRSEIEA